VAGTTQKDEATLLELLHDLPPERIRQVVDFARFLSEMEEEDAETIAASEAHWDALFARPESQLLLKKMALEALAEEEAGLTFEMKFDRQGKLVKPNDFQSHLEFLETLQQLA
jgi:hypothetical protein